MDLCFYFAHKARFVHIYICFCLVCFAWKGFLHFVYSDSEEPRGGHADVIKSIEGMGYITSSLPCLCILLHTSLELIRSDRVDDGKTSHLHRR